jgi:hypothetical protein
MRKFFFVGKNNVNKSGISIKIWKIERHGRTVQVWWGPARVDLQQRRVRRRNFLLTKVWRFSTAELAEDALRRKIKEKEREGYERSPRRRR